MLGKFESLISVVVARTLEKFADRHKGESCYIFGDGPSLKWFDLKFFRNLPSICCGLLPFHKDFNKLDVRYCLLVEPWVFAPEYIRPRKMGLAETNLIAKAYKEVIRQNRQRSFFIHVSNCYSLWGRNVDYVFRSLPRGEQIDKLLNQFNLFGGSFHASLALAYHLGFSKVYLLGFDAWTIQPSRNMHWYEFGEGIFFKSTNFATDFLEILKRRIDIYTISMDGESCNVENISYEKYTGQRPLFKENTEIVEDRYLKLLASYPEYEIYPDKAKRVVG
jgi:hypothetical protein